MVGRTGDGTFLHTSVHIEGVPCTALIDTGSSITIVRPDVLQQAGTDWRGRVYPTPVMLKTVTGELAPMKGKGWLQVEYGGVTKHHEVWLAAVQDPCILGLDFLQRVGTLLDLRYGNIVHSGSCPTTPHLRPNAAASAGIRHPITNEPHATLQSPPTQPETRLAVETVWRNSCEGLCPQQCARLWALLAEFQDSFATCPEETGRTHLVQHSIDTGDARPIRQQPRRLPLARQGVADRILTEMQEADIIEPSDSCLLFLFTFTLKGSP